MRKRFSSLPLRNLSLLIIIWAVAILLQPHLQSIVVASPAFQSVPWRTLPSLLRSLLHRIANHRLARADTQGADRVRSILDAVGSGIQFWRRAGSMGWDYLIHYAWSRPNPAAFVEIVTLVNELQSVLGELVHLRSDSERLQWISANYSRVLRIIKSVLEKLLKYFDHSGAIHDCLCAVQTEVVTGDLIRDALELGAADLQGLVLVAKDIFQKYFHPPTHQEL